VPVTISGAFVAAGVWEGGSSGSVWLFCSREYEVHADQRGVALTMAILIRALTYPQTSSELPMDSPTSLGERGGKSLSKIWLLCRSEETKLRQQTEKSADVARSYCRHTSKYFLFFLRY
jgi:hypothetical protein